MDVSAFARRLRGARDWSDIDHRLRALASTSPPAAVVELADALDAELAVRGPDLAVWSVRDRLLALLAGVPGREATVAAVRLAADDLRRVRPPPAQYRPGRTGRPAAAGWRPRRSPGPARPTT